MALNFPSAPNVNATYTFSDKTWTYNGNAWALSYGTLNTGVVPEGSNLYFSNARVYSNVSQLGYITSSALSGYATNAQLSSFATTANSLSQFASTTSLQLATLISDETGSGALVFATSPTLVTPALGTPSSGNLTNCTFPTFNQNTTGSAATLTTSRNINGVSFNGSADITVTAAADTLSGATLASGVTASSLTSFGNSPTLVTPNLGTPSAVVLTNASGTANNLTANIANFINVTDDTTTNASRYLIFANGTSGAITEQVSSTKLFFNPSTGLLTSTDYNSSSDKRLKKNIKTVESALDKVIALRGVSFNWKEGGAKAIGLIAQEAEKVIPEIVLQDENGYLGIKYNNLIGVLVEAIKEQQEQINTLKKLIEKT
jgi:hypothetical protein